MAAHTALVHIPVCSNSEMGLLGVAVDPSFANNGYIYLYRSLGADCSDPSGRVNQIVRVTMSAGAVSIGSLSVLLDGIRTDGGNHDGGGLHFGPDGKLYAAVGDTGLGDGGAPGDSTNPYAQDLGALEGKVLRLETDGTAAAGNPFAAVGGARAEVYARGFRNPFRFGFDPITGALWLGDVGQDTYEEIDIVHAGGNYSWPYCEANAPTGCSQPGDVAPVHFYEQHPPAGASVVGGSFANFGAGSDYFFADFVLSEIYRGKLNAARDGFAAPPTVFDTDAGGPVDIVTGPDGAIYYAALFKGQVRRISGSDPKSSPPPSAGLDRTPPRAKLAARRRQSIRRMSLRVSVDEPARVTVTGSVTGPGAARTRRFSRVVRDVQSGTTRVRLKLRRASLRGVERALRKGRKLRARVVVRAVDAAGNTAVARATVSLRR